MDQSYQKLLEENKVLKEKLEKELTKEPCYRCEGSGKIWTYWDGDTYCPHCSGTGRV
jgi:DnaJ-class molecular chaperone